jgi:tRNA modification GTPase
VDVTPDAEITGRIEAVSAALEELERTFARGRIVHSGMTLAIVGRPNVGKSSLFNRLVERERAIVTAMPGTTRDLVTETVSLGGIPLQLIDTAGLREAVNEAESIGIQKSREALADADVVLVVLETGVPVREDESSLIASVEGRGALVARNKSDLGFAAEILPELALPVVNTSAITGEGIEQLREELLKMISNPASESESGMLTNIRHHEAVTAALTALAKAVQAMSLKTPHEMLLLDLYAALRQLDSLTGETTADDILNRIFSTFCIGK